MPLKADTDAMFPYNIKSLPPPKKNVTLLKNIWMVITKECYLAAIVKSTWVSASLYIKLPGTCLIL